jgi:hypothetical protein
MATNATQAARYALKWRFLWFVVFFALCSLVQLALIDEYAPTEAELSHTMSMSGKYVHRPNVGRGNGQYGVLYKTADQGGPIFLYCSFNYLGAGLGCDYPQLDRKPVEIEFIKIRGFLDQGLVVVSISSEGRDVMKKSDVTTLSKNWKSSTELRAACTTALIALFLAFLIPLRKRK